MSSLQVFCGLVAVLATYALASWLDEDAARAAPVACAAPHSAAWSVVPSDVDARTCPFEPIDSPPVIPPGTHHH